MHTKRLFIPQIVEQEIQTLALTLKQNTMVTGRLTSSGVVPDTNSNTCLGPNSDTSCIQKSYTNLYFSPGGNASCTAKTPCPDGYERLASQTEDQTVEDNRCESFNFIDCQAQSTHLTILTPFTKIIPKGTIPGKISVKICSATMGCFMVEKGTATTGAGLARKKTKHWGSTSASGLLMM